jgi:hypothetical protein
MARYIKKLDIIATCRYHPGDIDVLVLPEMAFTGWLEEVSHPYSSDIGYYCNFNKPILC